MKSLQEYWETYDRKVLIPAELPDEARDELRKAFWVGVMALSATFDEVSNLGKKDALRAYTEFRRVHQEIEAFLQKLEQEKHG